MKPAKKFIYLIVWKYVMSSNETYQQIIVLIVFSVVVLGVLTVYDPQSSQFSASITGNALAVGSGMRVVRAPVSAASCREFEGGFFRYGPTVINPLAPGRTIIPEETKIDYCAGADVGQGQRILREYYCKGSQQREREDIDCAAAYNTWCETTSFGSRCVPCRQVYTNEECNTFENTLGLVLD